MLDQNREFSSAIPPHPMWAHWPQAEQNKALLRFDLCRGLHTTTPEAQAAMLDQVGHLIGVTKDRLRGIQNKALLKLPGLFVEPS